MEVTQRIDLYCSDRGRHGRIDFDSFDVTGERITHVRFRTGRSGVAGDGVALEDGEAVEIAVPARGLLPVESRQDDRGTWRWPCPKCRQDYRFTDANLRRILLALAANPGAPHDLCLIPR